MKRAESSVNRDTREKVEAEALREAKQAEAERRKLGKGAWFMKECAFLHPVAFLRYIEPSYACA